MRLARLCAFLSVQRQIRFLVLHQVCKIFSRLTSSRYFRGRCYEPRDPENEYFIATSKTGCVPTRDKRAFARNNGLDAESAPEALQRHNHLLFHSLCSLCPCLRSRATHLQSCECQRPSFSGIPFLDFVKVVDGWIESFPFLSFLICTLILPSLDIMVLSQVVNALKKCLPVVCVDDNDDRSSQRPSQRPSQREEPVRPPTNMSQSGFRFRDSYDTVKKFNNCEEGEISVVRSHTSKKLFVLKITKPATSRERLRLQNNGRRTTLPNEATMLSRLPDHRNIVHFFHVERPPAGDGRHLIYLEYCSGGDLLEQLMASQRTKFPTPPVFTLHVLVSLAQALAFLHYGTRWNAKTARWTRCRGRHDAIIHGDIKPDNIFLRWPVKPEHGMPDIVLGDFGMSQFAHSSWGITGTPSYDSPEVLAVSSLRNTDREAYERERVKPQIMTEKSDVYQMGLLIHLLATGRHWRTGDDPTEIEYPVRGFSEAVVGVLPFMVWCLQSDAEERPRCAIEVEDGCLPQVNEARWRRDRMVSWGEGVEGVVWERWEFAEVEGRG